MQALPWHVLAGKSTQHDPRRPATADGHDKTAALGNSSARFGGNHSRSRSSGGIVILESFDFHFAF
jgi:hypothetical protein